MNTLTYSVIVKHQDGAGTWLPAYQAGNTHVIKPAHVLALAREVAASWDMPARAVTAIRARDLRANNFPSFTISRAGIQLHFIRGLDLNLSAV
jgi:hypothetical protein